MTIQLPDNSQTRYLWQDGSTSSIRTITQAGTYFVTATTGVYSVTDTLHVRILPPVVLPQDTTLCRGEKLTLIPNYPGHALHWSTGSTDSTLTVSQAGQYWVKVDSHTCPIADTINVQVIDCPDNVPNIFTPNGDGINETFIIDNIELRPWQLAIYNRWGARVFESESYHNQWCGEGLPTGVYYYELFCQPLRRRLKGWVQILR
ncbi:gliding motility-associated C-terminal domain-containing protein [Spirosoma telluris]|uniref:gliding motility-associated C-terminal domain-containing protein n=1 Tax=Spirosoma telluris TaxID=2183553 RepID=UPI0013143C1C